LFLQAVSDNPPPVDRNLYITQDRSFLPPSGVRHTPNSQFTSGVSISSSSLNAKLGCAAALFCLVSPSNVAARAQTQVAAIPAGTPTDVSVNSMTGLVYVPSGRQVDVISEKTNKIAYSIPVATAYGLVPNVINPATNTLYVGDQRELFVVNATTRQVNVPAAGLAVNVATNEIYVSDFNSNVYVIDGATNNIVKDIALPTGVENLAVNPVTNRIYVATEDGFFGHVVVIDGNTDSVITTVKDGGMLAFNVGVDVIRNLVYVADEFGTVSVINGATNTLSATIQVGGEPGGLAVDPLHQRVYFNNGGLNAVQTINTATNTVINTACRYRVPHTLTSISVPACSTFRTRTATYSPSGRNNRVFRLPRSRNASALRHLLAACGARRPVKSVTRAFP
jgi:YVTN family beta-propeller protein